MRSESSNAIGAVILAAGRSTRMGDVDKLFITVKGRSLLAYALGAFQECPAVQRIALALSPSTLQLGQDLVRAEGFDKVTAFCLGGARRQDSVRAGLLALGHCRVVLIHDGARPLVTTEIILDGIAAVEETGAAVAAVPVIDTIKESKDRSKITRTLSREGLWAAQTPQVFFYDLLLAAHERVQEDVTDDAAMLEFLSHPVTIFPGSSRNIKITAPEDLALAEALLSQKK